MCICTHRYTDVHTGINLIHRHICDHKYLHSAWHTLGMIGATTRMTMACTWLAAYTHGSPCMQARMRLGHGRSHDHVGSDEDLSEAVSPRLKGLSKWGPLRSPTSSVNWGDFGDEDESGVQRRRQSFVSENGADERARGMLLSYDEQMVMWFYKLAEAEEVLETSVATVLRIGFKDLPAMYSTLQSRCPWSNAKQGDLLMWCLRGPLRHDTTYMAANMRYRGNRDRVITMGLELHDKALALHKQCPEFSLTYPGFDPNSKWQRALATVDAEVGLCMVSVLSCMLL